MKKEYEILKGTKDSIPSKQIKINFVLDVIREQFEKYGFRPFDTPIIEYLETLTNKYDDDAEIVQEIFKLSDRGDRKLGLRYDLTVPLCRYISITKQLKKPFRRYQIGKVFRDGPIKLGRDREFIQCDGDVIGINGREIEAELMILFYETYTKLKINAVIELNNNKILRGAFLQEGFKDEDLESLILSVDKLKKIGYDNVLKEIKTKGFDEQKIRKSLEILGCKKIIEIKKLAKNKILKEGIDELEQLISLIKPFVDYRINFSMSRGLNIYTGNIWEAYMKDEKILSSIGSGGRYDNVIGEFQGTGDVVDAVGISFGLVPILNGLDDDKIIEKETLTDLLVMPLDSNCVIKCFELVKKLRENKNVELFYGNKVKQAFSYAESLKIKEIAFIGEKEIENKKFKIKNIQTGVEREYEM
ncbi:MAG: histidine--tRNA ligase [Nanoarchaeota archaeon]